MKTLLTVDELIEHMKAKGITFNEVSEKDAKDFLEHNNYYMKLAAYRTNYDKCTTGTRAGQYVKLDFGYLKELSTLDMHLRYFVVEMCLDIEHAIKVKLMEGITNNPSEDGYEIVKKFLSHGRNIDILKQIQNHKAGEYCKDLINKYYPFFPAWVFLELISFGNLLYFCSFYEETYGCKIINNNLMNTVRDLRNASAHSNCLLNKMAEKLDSTKQPHSDITNFVKRMKNISSQSRRNNLGCKFVYNFVTLLFVYNSLMPEVARTKRYKQLKDFMGDRVIRNKSYFKSNSKICGVYLFLKKVIDNLQVEA